LCGDLLDGSVLGFRDLEENVDDEKQLHDDEDDENVGSNVKLDWFEGESDQEVCAPVCDDCDRRGGGSRLLTKELSHEEPGNGARTHSETDHKQNHHHNRNVGEGLGLDIETDKDHCCCDEHNRESSQHEGFPARLFNEDQRHQGHGDVAGSHSKGGHLSLVLIQASGFEDRRRVEDRRINTGELLCQHHHHSDDEWLE